MYVYIYWKNIYVHTYMPTLLFIIINVFKIYFPYLSTFSKIAFYI